jgi:hypothetical protein
MALHDIIFRATKYVFEALGIAFVARYIIGQKTNFREILMMTATITSILIVLDIFAPAVGLSTRQGAGFSLGLQMTAGPTSVAVPTTQTDAAESVQLPTGQTAIEPGAIQSGGMADPLALYYFSHNQSLDGVDRALLQPDVQNALVATDLEPHGSRLPTTRPEQVNTLMRGIMGLIASNKPDVHQIGEATIMAQPVNVVEGFTDKDAASTNAPAATVGKTATAVAADPMMMPSAPGTHKTREGQTLYSNDLINIATSDGRKLILPVGSDNILAVLPEGPTSTGDRLFKLRFKIRGNRVWDRLVPVHYGDVVNIVFNDEAVKERALNHDRVLNALNSSKNIDFSLVKRDSINSTQDVKFNDNIVIKTLPTGQFLAASPSGTIMSVADIEKATIFKLVPQVGCGPLWRFDTL